MRIPAVLLVLSGLLLAAPGLAPHKSTCRCKVLITSSGLPAERPWRLGTFRVVRKNVRRKDIARFNELAPEYLLPQMEVDTTAAWRLDTFHWYQGSYACIGKIEVRGMPQAAHDGGSAVELIITLVTPYPCRDTF